MRRLSCFAVALPLVLSFIGQAQGQDNNPPVGSPASKALMQEIERAKGLELPGMPRPHHIATTLIGEHQCIVEASLGALIHSDRDQSRAIKVELRVGEPSFDSSNFLGAAEEPVVVAPAPLDDDPEALRRTVWLLADRAYKNATETFEAKRAHYESMAQQRSDVADFAAAAVESFRNTTAPALPPNAPYADLAKEVSAVFSGHSQIHRSVVRILSRRRNRTLVTSEGTSIEDANLSIRVEIVAWTQADDGMVLADCASFTSRRFEDLPTAKRLVAMAEEVASRLEKVRTAPVVDDYAGPVLFEGRASPQLLRFLLADELSDTAAPEPSAGAASSSALASRVGGRVLPLGFEVTDDPSLGSHEGLALSGGYMFDDEGVRAQRVAVVREGKLQALLSSRMPSERLSVSNGHGRAGIAGHARGRVSNLLVSTRQGRPAASLRARLLAAARHEGLDHAIVVAGFDEPSLTEHAMSTSAGTAGGVVLPRPTEVYRIRAGAPPELVRGAAIQALRTRDLRHVMEAGRDLNAYSYLASSSPVRAPGAFGGEIPTTIVAPSLLMPDADVTRPTSPHPLPPIASKPE